MPETNAVEPNGIGGASPEREGGLRAPPELGFEGKTWWWFHFLILVNLARLRFVVILAAIGLVIVKWDVLVAHYDKWTRPHSPEPVASADVEYFCPMHPTVIRDNAKEKCPICFMPLSRRKKGAAKTEALPPGIVSRLQLSPYRVVLAGIQTSKVAYVPLFKEITTVGSMEFNERELKHVAARVKARIDKLFVNETGQWVSKDEELASLYSPDLIVTVQNLLDAKRNNNASLEESTRDRLRQWGIQEDQINDLLKAGKAKQHLIIRSPIKGHVLKKYVKEGQYVDEGSPLYDVVDLSTIWIQAQIYEDDMAFLPTFHRPLKNGPDKLEGLRVTATTPASPGETFSGRLSFVYPHVDQDTRTVVARFELENEGHKLRPGTSATVKFKVPAKQLQVIARALAEDWGSRQAVESLRNVFPSGGLLYGSGLDPLIRAAGNQALFENGLVLAIPESSVIDTGNQRIVYRERSPGEFEGVTVRLGPRMVGPQDVAYYPVLAGLEANDRIVTAGSFLLDAETRLNPAAGSIYFGSRKENVP